MDSSVVLPSFHCNAYTHTLIVYRKLLSSPIKRNVKLVSCVKTIENASISKLDVSSVVTNQRTLEKNPQSTTFPNGFEELVRDVCDKTEIAELKLKVGSFEMHLKRNAGATKKPLSNIYPTESPPIPTKPMDASAPITPPLPGLKPPAEMSSPFTNVSFGKASRLTTLEASGAQGFVLVASPTVGTFRRNRTVKGKKQPPIFKEGDVIKEGQVIGYLDQFGTELPVKSDVTGEVLKLLFDDGEAVGYGDPLMAVLPFHGINN